MARCDRPPRGTDRARGSASADGEDEASRPRRGMKSSTALAARVRAVRAREAALLQELMEARRELDELLAQMQLESAESTAARSWAQLSPKERAAAAHLGWNAKSWSVDEAPRGFRRVWAALRPDERAAAQDLGFDESGWDARLKLALERADGGTADAAAAPAHGSNGTAAPGKPTKPAYDRQWAQLTPAEREAAKELGWTWRAWNQSSAPKGFRRFWATLRPAERASAQVLGFDEPNWDMRLKCSLERAALERGDEDDAAKGNGDGSQPGRLKRWAQLTPTEVDAAKRLGWELGTWEAGETPKGFVRPWAALRPPERAAATTLGYTSEEWDEEVMSHIDKPQSGAQPKKQPPAQQRGPRQPAPGAGNGAHANGGAATAEKPAKDKGWNEMSESERSAAATLGWEEDTWEDGVTPATGDKLWGQLSDLEAAAAEILGYDAEKWDEEVGEEA